MKDRQIVDVLYISLLEVGVHAEFLAEVVQRVECFCLRLGDGRDGGVARQGPEAHEVPTSVLEGEALGRGIRRGKVEDQRPLHKWRVGLFKSGGSRRLVNIVKLV